MLETHRLRGTITNRQVAKNAKTTNISGRSLILFASSGFFAVRSGKG
jgi:hypothetical protein